MIDELKYNRQKLGVKRWLNNNGKGVLCYPTGFGKTFTALIAIKLLINKNPDAFVLISVPTEILKKQWLEKIIQNNLMLNCKVEIINTIVKQNWNVDLLVIDEIHLTPTKTYSKIFEVVQYKLILGLTGTLERLDGKEILIKKYCPVVDKLSVEEATKNHWVSESKEYVVMLDVDLTEYNKVNQKFNSYFAFFDWKFDIAMACATNAIYRNKYATQIGVSSKEVAAIAADWMRCMHARKNFVMSHPKKLEIAQKILKFRSDRKCITFSATIQDAKKFKNGYVLHSKQSKKVNSSVLEKFNSDKTGVLHSSKAADQGLDVDGLSVEIILSVDSSKIRKAQRKGRVIRFAPDKVAEIFTLVLKGTQEVYWFANSVGSNYQVINEKQLDDILNGKVVNTRQKKLHKNIDYRF